MDATYIFQLEKNNWNENQVNWKRKMTRMEFFYKVHPIFKTS